MEAQFSWSFILSSLLLLWFLYALIKLFKTSKTSNLPPSPWKLPILGNIHHLASGAPPHVILRDLSLKLGPLLHLQLGEISAVVISSPRVAKEAMKTHDVAFAERPEALASKIMLYDKNDIGFAPYGGYWRQMRKISAVELLGNKTLSSFRSIREQEIYNMVSSIRSSIGTPINLTEMTFSLSCSIVCRAAFGKKLKVQETLSHLVTEALSLMGGMAIADLFPSVKILNYCSGLRRKLEAMHRKLDGIFNDIIADRRREMKIGTTVESESSDFLDVFLRLQKSKDMEYPIQDENIKAVIFDMFAGGIETVSSTIEWAMSELIKHPRVMEKAVAEVRQCFKGKETIKETDTRELNYLKFVIKETLRLHPGGPALNPRQCRESCSIDGYDIPVNTKVLINSWAIGRDPNYWENAESFIPERFEEKTYEYIGTSFEYIPFGSGRRICPGLSFGLAVVELAIAQLLYHFNWSLPNGMKPELIDMTESSGFTAKRKNDLYLVATSSTGSKLVE